MIEAFIAECHSKNLKDVARGDDSRVLVYDTKNEGRWSHGEMIDPNSMEKYESHEFEQRRQQKRNERERLWNLKYAWATRVDDHSLHIWRSRIDAQYVSRRYRAAGPPRKGHWSSKRPDGG